MFCYHLDTCMQFHLSGHVCGRAKSNKKYRCAFACAGFYALVIIFYHILFTTSNVFFFNWIVQIKMMVFVLCKTPSFVDVQNIFVGRLISSPCFNLFRLNSRR